MRLTHWLSLCLAAGTLAAVTVGVARAAQAMRAPDDGARVRTLCVAADHYRSVAWTYQRAARIRRTPTTFSYRRSHDPRYLQWTVKLWQQHEYNARSVALRALERRFGLDLPAAPSLHASLQRRIAFERNLTVQLHPMAPGRASRSLASVRTLPASRRLFTLQQLAARATLALSQRSSLLDLIGPRWLTDAFMCIHGYEGAWNANSGNGYYGGLQMDSVFMHHYGGDFMRRWGTADRWPPWAQVQASVRAYRSGRGFWPWPNTARFCGLL